jgi:hypothetical protein
MKTKRSQHEAQGKFSGIADTYKIVVKNIIRSNRVESGEYCKLHIYDDDAHNSKVFNMAKALEKVRDEAEKFHDEIKGFHTSFHLFFRNIYERRNWNSYIFKEKTLLDDKIHSLLRNRHDHKPSKRTVLAIAAGAGLDISTTEKLLAAAGYVFDGSLHDDIYKYVLIHFKGCPIIEINEALAGCGVRPLGTFSR